MTNAPDVAGPTAWKATVEMDGPNFIIWLDTGTQKTGQLLLRSDAIEIAKFILKEASDD